MKRLRLLINFIIKFKMVNGVFLFFKFYNNKVETIKLPNLKHPIFLRNTSSDIQTFYQVFLYDEYEFKFPEPPKIVIDAGANVGLFSLYIKNKYPETNVICIEPDEENFKVLKKNLISYDLVFFENCGLWKSETKLRVYDKYNVGKWGMVVEEDKNSGNTDAVSLNFLMEKYNINQIDVLKIDIETSEKQLFLENYEHWLPKVKIIIIELHDWMEEGCSKPFFNAINNTFKNYSYSISGENTIIVNNDLP